MWLIAAAAVIVAAYLSVVFVAPVVLVVAGAIAGGVVLVEYAAASVWVFRGAAAPIGHLRIEPRPAVEGQRTPPEPAYRSYYFGPVFRDYSLALRTAAERSWERSFAGRPADQAAGRPSAVRSLSQHLYERWTNVGLYVPVNPAAAKAVTAGPMAGGMIGLAAGAVGAAAVTAAISAVFGLVLVLTVVVAVLTAGVLRLIEIAALRVRGITIECGVCHRRATSPAYLCSYCKPVQDDGSDRGALHRRLVPGSLGVFSRICRCGNPLPTLLARGKFKLEGFCQYEDCNAALPVKGLTAPTFHVPVVAGRQAGKTVFMMAAAASLEQQARNGSGAEGFEFADPAGLQQYLAARAALKQETFSAIGATLPVVSIPALNIYLGRGRGRRLMYLYDAAGERFEQESGVATLRFLEHSGGVVVILDPFSFPAIRRSTESTILAEVRPSVADADDVLGRFTEGLRQSVGGRAGRKLNVKVAVVLTKCDALLESTDVAHPYDQLNEAAGDPGRRAERSAAVRGWLGSVAGQQGLLAGLENTFGQCEFFAVSARDAFVVETRTSSRTLTAVRNDDTAAPLRWLLERRDRS